MPDRPDCRQFPAAVVADQFDVVKVGVGCAVPGSAVEAEPADRRAAEVASYR